MVFTYFHFNPGCQVVRCGRTRSVFFQSILLIVSLGMSWPTHYPLQDAPYSSIAGTTPSVLRATVDTDDSSPGSSLPPQGWIEDTPKTRMAHKTLCKCEAPANLFILILVCPLSLCHVTGGEFIAPEDEQPCYLPVNRQQLFQHPSHLSVPQSVSYVGAQPHFVLPDPQEGAFQPDFQFGEQPFYPQFPGAEAYAPDPHQASFLARQHVPPFTTYTAISAEPLHPPTSSAHFPPRVAPTVFVEETPGEAQSHNDGYRFYCRDCLNGIALGRALNPDCEACLSGQKEHAQWLQQRKLNRLQAQRKYRERKKKDEALHKKKNLSVLGGEASGRA